MSWQPPVIILTAEQALSKFAQHYVPKHDMQALTVMLKIRWPGKTGHEVHTPGICLFYGMCDHCVGTLLSARVTLIL